MRIPRLLILAALQWGVLGAQAPTVPAKNSAGTEDGAELATQEAPATFRSGVNLVSIPVVVRDGNGRVVENLKKENFQIFDRGKPQAITRFLIEHPAEPPMIPPDDGELEKTAANGSSAMSEPGIIAQHYTAYLFDDVHLSQADLPLIRDAAVRHLQNSLLPSDRAAVFTTSGQVMLDFTADLESLRQALLRLRTHPIAGDGGAFACPDVNYYMADAIENKNDTQALLVATAEAMNCMGTSSTAAAQQIAHSAAQQTADSAAQQMAHSAAQQKLSAGVQEARVSMDTMRGVIRRMSILPGQRSIILASPGFFLPDDLRSEESETMDRAVRANVVISSLDARGLYTVDLFGDISQSTISSAVAGQKATYIREDATVKADVLAELAHGTGGSFFQNSNDLVGGFAKLAATPGTIYLLAFSPENLKMDGSFHQLKIKLVNTTKLDAQARRGYYAPKHAVSEEDAAKEQIREEVFSREELRNGSVDLHTQFFKVNDTDSSLSVITHLILKQIHFEKVNGRNQNEVTIVSALFDRNGNFIKAYEKILKMKLKDETLNKVPRLTIKADFDVPPGSYVVRLVVRDSSGQMMAAENGAVEIPY